MNKCISPETKFRLYIIPLLSYHRFQFFNNWQKKETDSQLKNLLSLNNESRPEMLNKNQCQEKKGLNVFKEETYQATTTSITQLYICKDREYTT